MASNKADPKRRLTERHPDVEDTEQATMTEQDWVAPVIDDVEVLTDLETVRFSTQRASGGAVIPKRTQLAIAASLLEDEKVAGAMKERLSGKCSSGKVDKAQKAAHAIASKHETSVTRSSKRKAEDSESDDTEASLSDHSHSS